jgi:hypothetical protein
MEVVADVLLIWDWRCKGEASQDEACQSLGSCTELEPCRPRPCHLSPSFKIFDLKVTSTGVV